MQASKPRQVPPKPLRIQDYPEKCKLCHCYFRAHVTHPVYMTDLFYVCASCLGHKMNNRSTRLDDDTARRLRQRRGFL